VLPVLGPVDEVEVDIVQLEVDKGLQEGRFDVGWVVFAVPNLGRDENLLAFDLPGVEDFL